MCRQGERSAAIGFCVAGGAWTCSAGGGPADIDRRMMRRCVELAQRAVGCTRPNPIVGCVITSKDGLVAGEGFHARAGGPHAEVVALNLAGEDARGGTAYVSLEPCNHFGRTPPCSDALVRMGIGRVVVGMVDPDPRTAGGGVAKLREKGIEVTVGVEEGLCQAANEGFVHRVRHKRPLGTWKYAMTLDGKTASDVGSSQWISGPPSRSSVQQLRRETDAIVVGSNTVRKDNPRLTLRESQDAGRPPELQPIRVVMSRSLDLPLNAQLWDVSGAATVVFTEPSASPEFQKYLLAKGVTVVPVEHLSPSAVMDHLYELGCLNVLWECGGGLAAEAIREGCVQKLVAFVGPKLIGGGEYTPLAHLGIDDMGEAIPVHDVRAQMLESDIMITGRMGPPPQPPLT